jgi:hypothetical protein
MADKETTNNRRIGDGTPGPGRPKGVPNRATTAVRDVFSAFVEANAGRAQALFEQVARKDPAKALDLLARLSEFVIPKLARTELSGEIGVRGKLVIND